MGSRRWRPPVLGLFVCLFVSAAVFALPSFSDRNIAAGNLEPERPDRGAGGPGDGGLVEHGDDHLGHRPEPRDRGGRPDRPDRDLRRGDAPRGHDEPRGALHRDHDHPRRVRRSRRNDPRPQGLRDGRRSGRGRRDRPPADQVLLPDGRVLLPQRVDLRPHGRDDLQGRLRVAHGQRPRPDLLRPEDQGLVQDCAFTDNDANGNNVLWTQTGSNKILSVENLGTGDDERHLEDQGHPPHQRRGLRDLGRGQANG